MRTKEFHSHNNQVKLSEVECGSLSLYVGEVGETSKVELGESGARVMVSATTIETEAGLDCEEGGGCSRRCRSALLIAACACLPWQLNHPVQAPACVGDLQASCASQVNELWESAGGNLELAKSLVEQELQMSLASFDCKETDCRLSTKHHIGRVTQPGCGSNKGELEILIDLANSLHYTRQMPSWTEMFGVVGGIVALVTGASLASIFEIIYFLTVRFWEEGGKVS